MQYAPAPAIRLEFSMLCAAFSPYCMKQAAPPCINPLGTTAVRRTYAMQAVPYARISLFMKHTYPAPKQITASAIIATVCGHTCSRLCPSGR